MHRVHGVGLILGLVVVITLGVPVALSGLDSPLAGAALRVIVDEAAAQTNDCAGGGGGISQLVCQINSQTSDASGGDGSGTGGSSDGGDGGAGGDATSSTGRGGNGGLALLHELISTSATSNTSQSLSDAQTGDIHNERTIIIEDTDETVVINMAGNPGSTGIHMLNVGAPSHAVNTGGNTGSADASGGDSGDATATGGRGGTGGDGGIGGLGIGSGGSGGVSVPVFDGTNEATVVNTGDVE